MNLVEYFWLEQSDPDFCNSPLLTDKLKEALGELWMWLNEIHPWNRGWQRAESPCSSLVKMPGPALFPFFKNVLGVTVREILV